MTGLKGIGCEDRIVKKYVSGIDLLDKLTEKKVIVDCVFEEEYTFSYPIATANVVTTRLCFGKRILD